VWWRGAGDGICGGFQREGGGAGGARALWRSRCARMRAITAGSWMRAMTRRVPPQRRQVWSVAPNESGLASGILQTSSMMGGAVGLAISATLCTARTSHLLASNVAQSAALTGGYQVAFLFGATCAAMATLLSAVFLRPGYSLAR
jgi:hypothetical protein